MAQTLNAIPKVVLFDAGGVLLTPPLDALSELTHGRLDIDQVRRVFYATYATQAMAFEHDLVGFWVRYADNLGLENNPFEGLDPRSDAAVRWNQPAAGAAEVLSVIKSHGVRVAVVSNGSGEAQQLLAEAEVCHLGANGPGTEIDAIFDSGDSERYPDEVLSRKPATKMLDDALTQFDALPHEALFVGDALWSDGLAAHRAKVPFVHVDPFGDCLGIPVEGASELAPSGHDHAKTVADVLPYALGKLVRSVIG